MSGLPYLDAAAVERLVPMGRAVDVLEEALRAGLDPEATPRRPIVDLPAGQLLLMPAATRRYAGVKAVSIAPANPERGLPRIQGTYLLFDGDTLAPLAALDGIALTSLRTPAVSALAVRHLAEPGARRLVVFGSGPQAYGHVLALREVRPVEDVTVVARDRRRAEALAAWCRECGLSARALAGGAPPSEPPGPRPGAPATEAAETVAAEVAEAVGRADLIACCTTARHPLFPGKLARDGVTVVAVGSHEPGARELDGDLIARATVVVEARAAALEEAGDIVVPIRQGTITSHHLAGNLADLTAGRVVAGPGPRVFKSTGMAWEDLVVAAAAYEAADEGPGARAQA
ncbi:ornithine cyclodeaminase family protein [Nonomuraea gerenzanensis]|uniref:Ornithine cyclodeaminase n=1 Tax=Nonomuraea gerenzanensis TaxID=93944 RepID=A0A1M4EGT8_9ACTN|nr:ornithine cyclodeaminase family protein [Nonomuraea gerenzanensis]UBU09747.1 ornithine cyclodeaminase family protein [Nonomuraea gerenzanensis]SBO98187.1 Ornithine cyclodeaminase [Nonomuraea gerenzanensis]